MNRAEQLKMELQAQRLRLDKETRQKAELLQKSYESIAELNFLGWSPRQLEEAKVPLNFLKSAWQYKRMPSVDRVELPTAAPVVPAAPPTAPVRSQTRNERPSKKAKRGLHWDSEWVAPVTQKFGDNNWSSAGLIIDTQDSSDDEESVVQIVNANASANLSAWTEQESTLKASIESYKIDIKALTNHIRQTEETLNRQLKRLDEKKTELTQKKMLEAQATAKLKLLENRRSLSLAQQVNARRVATDPETSDVSMEEEQGEPEEAQGETTVEPEEPEEPEEPAEAAPEVAQEDVVLSDTGTEPSAEPEAEAEDVEVKDEPKGAKEEDETEVKFEPSEAAESETASELTAAPAVPAEAPQAPSPTGAPPLPGPPSALSLLSKYRLSPLWTLGNPAKVYSRTYNSFAVEDAVLCPLQLQGRQCEGGCDAAHFEDWDISHTQVLRHILENYLTSSQRKQFKAKLKSLANPDSTESMALLQSIYL